MNESTLNISGNAGKSVALTLDGTTYTAKNESADTKGEDSTYTRGFHLAGVDIPYPTGDYVQKTGATSLSDSAALCWVQRCTTEGKVAWVLSLVNGSCPTKKDISCSGSSGGSSTSKTCMWEESEGVAAYYDDELEKNFPGYKLVSELPQKGSDCSENETWACVKRADAPGYAGIFQCVQCSC
ncbi:MAG: hypothetical protein PUK24_01255 [Elusimicrobia bacterium]|nr:hypothetical protein [Elusimicrobiota bacterium]